ncbi:hypothetical protein ABB27_02425 [Stenotrophomonas terrae]|uniref:Ricin B lectin domain-containing protein n=1 Tax=Stenotrophomonas terrae TaxID=405446 RepID=A0A0R0CR14_9GAMM|nr:hypothetical protein [Stenotrophomonas terrae]KRG71766.1 hypothetical protein ABB27_02425 [Stenotrophomonas terrae]
MRTLKLTIYLGIALTSTSVFAETPPDVSDLVDARGAGGETQLLSRGYEVRDSNTVGDQRFTFWWKAKTLQCISVSTVDGRYASIQSVPAANCGGQSESDSQSSGTATRDGQSLVLVCYGAGTRPTVKSDPTYSWDKDDHKWKSSETVHSSTEGFNGDVQIELYGDHGRIHLSQGLVPPINSGGDHGWWELDNLVVGPGVITAGYRLNGMNKPRIHVDRRTGQITIQGASNFAGQCDIGNFAGGQRRF